MAVESPLTPLGAPLPDRTQPDLDGTPTSLAAHAAGRPLLVVFACNHCPYVKHVESELGRLAASFGSRVAVVAIASNDTESFPEDDVAHLRAQRVRAGWDFPYVLDADQGAARAFGAVCTPDFFVYDAAGALAYRGAFDGSTPKNGVPLTGDLLRGALDLVLAGEPVPLPHRPAMGCSIKWKGE